MVSIVRGKRMAQRARGSEKHGTVVASGFQIVVYNRGDKI
jgi:hypothetical protein